MAQGVQPHQIRQTEDAQLGAPHRGTKGGVDLFDGEVEGLHVAGDRADGEGADAVGDEVRGVLGVDDALAQPLLTEPRQGLHRSGVGLRPGDDLQQPHVADGVEEVGDEEVLLHLLGHVRDHGREGDARGVGGDDGAGPPVLRHPLVDLLLDGQVLDHHLDDQIALAEQRGVVVVIGGGDQGGGVRGEERGGLDLAGLGDALAGGHPPIGPLGQIPRHDVVEHRGHTGVGEMGGDALPHHTGAEDRDLLDRVAAGCHILSSRPGQGAPRLNEHSFSRGDILPPPAAHHSMIPCPYLEETCAIEQ